MPTSSPVARCPKRMVYGPCGGVRADARCEMADHPCVFVGPDRELPEWPWPKASGSDPGVSVSDPGGDPVTVAATSAIGSSRSQVPRVLTDLSTPPADARTLVATVQQLLGSCDALLVGDHQDRPDFPPSLLARLITDAGARPWVTLACRDRNRVVLEQELQALRLHGGATVLCVTGDGRAFDVRPDVSQVFDLDGTRLAALASTLGLPVAVAETPTAPPLPWRPSRLLQKQRAGADVAVLNHVATPVAVGRFVAAAHAAGVSIPIVASVCVFTDERSADVLAALPGLALDAEIVRRVLSAPDPVAAGIEAAVVEAAALLAIDGVAGVNLSGLASARGVAEAAAIQAEVGRRVQELR